MPTHNDHTPWCLARLIAGHWRLKPSTDRHPDFINWMVELQDLIGIINAASLVARACASQERQ